MQAMGLSSWRLTLPALKVALIFMLVGYSISFYLQPISYRAFKDLQVFLRSNYVSILLQEGVFSSPVEGLTVFIRERHDDGLLKGIIVHDSRKEGTAVTMMADEGTLVQTPQGPRFLLKDGNRQEEQDGKLSYLTYDSYALDVSLYTDAVGGARMRDPQELFVHDLLATDGGATERDISKRRAEFHQRILWPAYIPTLTLVAMAIFLSGSFNRRGGVKRTVLIAVVGTLVLFSSVGIRGVVTKYPDWSIILYIWWLIPTLLAWYFLKKDSGSVKAAAV
jgi:lipopolysaccharide export system permease protein